MNVLDENVLRDQRELLLSWHIRVRQIGHDFGRKGLRDEAILALLDRTRNVTFFTQAKRSGTVIRVSHTGLALWRIKVEWEERYDWE